MAFADGENLVARYQAVLAAGTATPKRDTLHEKDIYVWNQAFTIQARQSYEILRVTYYTSAVGDDSRLADIRRTIRSFTFARHSGSTLPNQLCATVIKRPANARAAKGVDIQLCVEALSHVHSGNVDGILLLTGDGDYIPLIDEARRAGVQVYLAAFSNGLNPSLLDHVDTFLELDGLTYDSVVV